jgi:hypothetical protein
MLSRTIALASAFALMSAAGVQAELTISNKPTKNVTCSGGTCSATAKKANLNVDELVTMLSSSDLVVASGSISQDLSVKNALSWSSAHKLTLESFRNMTFQAPLVSESGGALTLASGNGATGSMARFTGKGRIAFWDLNSTFIMGTFTYALVDSIQTLAGDIQSNPNGRYALANDYDAAADGVYETAPISTTFGGTLWGNGNTIRNLTIHAKHNKAMLGLFADITFGFVGGLHLDKADIRGKAGSTVGSIAASMLGNAMIVGVSVAGKVSSGPDSNVGGLAGSVLYGSIFGSSMSGSVSGTGTDTTGWSVAGGLIGAVWVSQDLTSDTSSSATVTGGIGWRAGGLAGYNAGTIYQSFATGTVNVADNGFAGGLVGDNLASLTDTYATGFTSGGVNSTVGGLIGHNQGPVAFSYSSGPVASGSGNAVGGLIGNDSETNDLFDTYWDTTTSGQAHGVGNDTSYPGVTGLTTEQFQAGLPAGFDPNLWVENADINGGLPYLLYWPPN